MLEMVFKIKEVTIENKGVKHIKVNALDGRELRQDIFTFIVTNNKTGAKYIFKGTSTERGKAGFSPIELIRATGEVERLTIDMLDDETIIDSDYDFINNPYLYCLICDEFQFMIDNHYRYCELQEANEEA